MRTFTVALVLALALLAGFAAQAAEAPAAKAAKALDLNTASRAELLQLPGVGPSRADAIIQFRASRPFRRTADLLRIKGFGRRTFVRLRPLVVVGPAAPPAALRPLDSAPQPSAPGGIGALPQGGASPAATPAPAGGSRPPRGAGKGAS